MQGHYSTEQNKPATKVLDTLQEELIKLNQMKSKGLITEEEYLQMINIICIH